MGKVFRNRSDSEYNLLKKHFHIPGTDWSIRDKLEIIQLLKRLERKLNIPGLSDLREVNTIIKTIEMHQKKNT